MTRLQSDLVQGALALVAVIALLVFAMRVFPGLNDYIPPGYDDGRPIAAPEPR